MKWLKRFFAKPETPNHVLLVMHDGEHKLKPVEWFSGAPYAAPHLPNTRCELLPGGRVRGVCYVKGWRPADERTKQHFDQPETAA